MTIDPKDLEMFPENLRELAKMLIRKSYAQGIIDALGSNKELDKSLTPSQ